MLRIRQVGHLAKSIGFSETELARLAGQPSEYYQPLSVFDPLKPASDRTVLNVRGALRRAQKRILQRIFDKRLKPSPFAYGGIKGRDIKSNAEVHAKSIFVLTADISGFFPTIRHQNIYRLFVERLDCTPDVAHILTPLCTYRHHLALGLITSPILAEQVMLPIDRRLSNACHLAGLRYTRYVDDITISGGFDLKESGFEATVTEILRQHGFKLNSKKTATGRIADGIPITKISLKNGHPDPRAEYLHELNRQLDDAKQLSIGGLFDGPYFTRDQILGRINFVKWINPGRERMFFRKFRSINWSSAQREARRRNYAVARKTLLPAT